MPVSQVPEPVSTDREMVALLAYAARSANGTGALVTLAGEWDWLVLEVVLVSVSGAGTLDVFVQQVLDGVNYDDVYHAQFTEIEAGTIRSASLPLRQRDAGGEQHVWNDAALGPNGVAAFALGRKYRVRWVLSGATWGFQVLAHLRSFRQRG